MKLQLQGQHLRLRIDESELAALRAGGTLVNVSTFGLHAWRQTLRQSDAIVATLHAESGDCAIEIPKTQVDAYAARLPCREGLSLQLQPADGPPLDVVLEVDVRDSVRTRGPRRQS
jgi:hypothetical protein